MNGKKNGMKLKPNCCTGVGFDNFDRYVETLSGKTLYFMTLLVLLFNVFVQIVVMTKTKQ